MAFKVVADDYVTSDSGSGIVHCAPAFGEDDYRVCVENQIITKVHKHCYNYGLRFSEFDNYGRGCLSFSFFFVGGGGWTLISTDAGQDLEKDEKT